MFLSAKEQWNEIQRARHERSEAFLSPHDGCIAIILDDGTKFYLDKDIVCPKSHYFKSLFSSNWTETEKIRNGVPINITGMSSEDIRTILQYLYVGDVRPIEAANAEEFFDKYWSLVYCAHFFGLFDFEEDLSDHCPKYITAENIFLKWNQAMIFQCRGLQRVCEEFMVHNFEEVSHQENFTSCPRQLLANVFSGGQINTSNPDSLFELVVHWGTVNLLKDGLEYSKENLQKYIIDLLPPTTLFSKQHKDFLLSM